MKNFTLPIIVTLTLSACQMATSEAPTSTEPASAASISEQLSKTACATPAPPRDKWLREERPSIEEVRAGYLKRGVDPEKSGVFRAYAAYLNAGQDHERAAEAYGPGYAASAACFA